ncbi:family 1 glycosylhydrolase [Rubrolithibacter danxiaensis]|uniref:family 1 glycosylhydrolase n=1 Tax=Rubrolithibacter danxiaensis TaxID=3390805 RepID=UPI003BF852F9
MDSSHQQEIEIWGGMECSVNRVQDSYFDQLDYSGHYKREEDFELFAQLEIKKIRYPLIWEKHQPEANTIIDWSRSKKSLNKLLALGIDPILGLVHHGSGPAYATIETENFATGLANYAAQVAEQFPWVKYYTPINEPLTTARFCGLYGIWYPHAKDTLSFFRILMNECKATILAMEAIRKINPEAKLVQSEDLSKTYSTPALKTQASYENKRRWLGFDLLSGKVKPGHSLWDYLLSIGLDEQEFEFFWEKNCPPDVIGFNHYPTSERYLDERIENFPECAVGSNGEQLYADVEAVRVKLDEENGVALLLKEAWERFKTPMVLTEVHMGCTREEQMRWLDEVLKTVKSLRCQGVDIRAITAWALLGSHGWTELLTSPPGIYEPGVFDIRGGKPRETALGKMIKSYSSGENFDHPLLENKGWWHRDLRVLYFHEKLSRKISSESVSSQPVLITGKTGTLGKAFARICELRGITYELLGRDDVDISNPIQLEQIIRNKRPWAIINAAGFVRVDDAETECSSCFLANAKGPATMAALCKKYGIKFLTFSSDLVFDGKKNKYYTESDQVSPLNIYGQSKALAEKLVLQNNPSSLIIRTSAFFGPWDTYNFVHNVLKSVKNKTPFTAASDLYISPTYVPDLVNTSLDILIDDERGIWHLANYGETTWSTLAENVAKRGGCQQEGLILPVPASLLEFKAQRPVYSVLNSERALLLPDLENALDRYFKEQELVLL